MNFNKILWRYKGVYIDFNDIKCIAKKEYSKNNMYYADLNNDIYNLFVETHHIDGVYNYNILKDGYMDKNGMYMNISSLKKDLLELFNIDLANAKKELEEILNKDDSYYSNVIKNNPALKKAVKTSLKYDKDYKGIESTTRHKNRVLKKYCEFLRKRVKLTLKLFEIEKDYVRVNEDVFDENKLNLYVAYKVINASKKLKVYDKKYVKYINYLKNYLEENYSLPHDSINFDNYSIEHVGKYYTDSYRKLCQDESIRTFVYNELGLTPDNTISYGFDFFDFETLTKDEMLTKLERAVRSNSRYVNYKEVLNRKIALYQELPFTTALKGKNEFDGYVGFVIDDRYVVLDKFYNDQKARNITVGNAIYIVTKEDFYELVTNSKKDAMDLIGLGLIDAVRVYHRGDYEKRVKDYINRGIFYVDQDLKKEIKTKGSLGD